MDDVRRRLREAAEAHQPDPEAMLVRIQRGMVHSADADRARSYRRRRQASWLKVSLAGLAVGTLGLGGIALAAGMRPLAPQRTTAVVTPGDTGASPQPRASATKPGAPIPGGFAATTPRHSASASADGPIAAHGSVDLRSNVYWEQNDVTVDVAQPLATLTVELRIPLLPGVQNTGSWQTLPAEDFTVTIAPADGFLVYRWVLKPGRTVPPTQQVFSAQFNQGTAKRDPGNDTFLVETTAAGRTVTVRGGFTAGS